MRYITFVHCRPGALDRPCRAARRQWTCGLRPSPRCRARSIISTHAARSGTTRAPARGDIANSGQQLRCGNRPGAPKATWRCTARTPPYRIYIATARKRPSRISWRHSGRTGCFRFPRCAMTIRSSDAIWPAFARRARSAFRASGWWTSRPRTEGFSSTTAWLGSPCSKPMMLCETPNCSLPRNAPRGGRCRNPPARM